jgi:hypothetical protein
MQQSLLAKESGHYTYPRRRAQIFGDSKPGSGKSGFKYSWAEYEMNSNINVRKRKYAYK